jgi:hypothetical protein
MDLDLRKVRYFAAVVEDLLAHTRTYGYISAPRRRPYSRRS